MRHLVPHGTPANFMPSSSQDSKRGHPQPSLPCTNAHTQWSGREKKIERDNLTVHRNRWLHGSGSSGPPVAQGLRAGGAARKSCTPAFAPGPQSLERTAMLVERARGGGQRLMGKRTHLKRHGISFLVPMESNLFLARK